MRRVDRIDWIMVVVLAILIFAGVCESSDKDYFRLSVDLSFASVTYDEAATILNDLRAKYPDAVESVLLTSRPAPPVGIEKVEEAPKTEL